MSDLIEKIADLQQPNRPDPILGVGREFYAFSDLEDKAFELLQFEAERLFQNIGIDTSAYKIETDAIGNLFVTFYGQNRSETVMAGSHVDSVYKGGMYDGVAGVQSAFQFLETLLEEGKTPGRNYTVAVFRSEEASPKTGNTCVGSRIATGTLKEEDLLKMNYKLDENTSIPFRKFFQEKYGTERWQAVLDELKNPPIRKDEVISYEELHIEQSAVCDLTDSDVGIVIDGIGGAIREVVNIPLEWKYVREFDPSKAVGHLKYTLKFHGEEAHTGGTPPNPSEIKQENGLWYRKDALISAAKFLEALECGPQRGMVKVTKFTIPEKVGFTTVPKEQIIEFIVPNELWDVMENYLADTAEDLQKQQGVSLDYEHEALNPERKVQYFDPEVFKALDIPLQVERLVRQKCQEQIKAANGGVGKVRGTVTDFLIDDHGSVHCNLDFRDVDPISIQNIRAQVHDLITLIAGDLMVPVINHQTVYTVSQKPFAPLDQADVETKSGIAKAQNMKVMKMPSLPGHDAASLSYAGIPVAMTFVRHDGRSHTGFETMTAKHYETAKNLSHAFLRQKLSATSG